MKVLFEWDAGNDVKSYSTHGVSRQEAESVFQDPRRLDFADPLHSQSEGRFVTLARSNHPRLLFVAWTLRKTKVRIISARPASRKERKVYEEKRRHREG
ncbi:MAG: BrnT family toxin [Deltaproteobacteria bacterium]|nr:BrnT family toxin [Deltaproteobacteria bacterium]